MHQRHAFMLRLHLETDKVLGTDMNDVTIPYALCLEENIVYNVISFREGYIDSENRSVVIRGI